MTETDDKAKQKRRGQDPAEFTEQGRIITDRINRSLMGRVLRIDVAHISRVLRGLRKPSLELASKMAEYLEITIESLYIQLKDAEKEYKRVKAEKREEARRLSQEPPPI